MNRMNEKWYGVTYPVPRFLQCKLVWWLWAKVACPQGWHLLDECQSTENHSLFCDACELDISITAPCPIPAAPDQLPLTHAEATLAAANEVLERGGIAGIYDEFDGLPDAIEQLTAYVGELEIQKQELEEALKFYASPHSYGIGGGSSNRVLYDAGKIAKVALCTHRHNEGRPTVDTLGQELAAAQAQLLQANAAVVWLWGFWDGNTLIPAAHDASLQEDIQVAFERCLDAVTLGNHDALDALLEQERRCNQEVVLSIVLNEIARQEKFGMFPSWEDFLIALEVRDD